MTTDFRFLTQFSNRIYLDHLFVISNLEQESHWRVFLAITQTFSCNMEFSYQLKQRNPTLSCHSYIDCPQILNVHSEYPYQASDGIHSGLLVLTFAIEIWIRGELFKSR